MTSIQIAGVAAAVAVALWPQVRYVWSTLSAVVPVRMTATGPSFTDAVDHLSKVRARLLATEALGEEQKKAIEVLTLALVAGSDQ